ncbi:MULTISPECIES: SDR family NAD(P)-dependent oxidoreductase [unclassified Pseudomonas]|jgi:NAD(P)-dependent dehydrogenase (short-subunit alcohol dehydrogenase family)|uniref:SDR family NAD(P)-dependent oxidoreductase n=1 Tax=unclassified Pseudomonas TaxID=196821 RepID=UPI000891D180|nr:MULTISPECIES: SDR family oxidoreductase [unclassified Pseudomonas]SCY84118.1 NAD(P)-dependent dehydrogenase, short-chain alcohol dehydrogenase family [Pseudomonas sp. NFACC37-1]SFO47158.1 NAD(P)-dependent dehydrogenase, short-chain alcohol dehydrogenase family [Pseudomonas sp. NFACC24-1]
MKFEEAFSVAGATVIVTGAASGLGLAFTEAMAVGGANVVMLDLNPRRLSTQADRLKDLGYSIASHVLNVTDRKAVDLIYDQVAATYGGIDVVFSNAGIDPGPGFAALNENGERDSANYLEQYADVRWQKVISVSLDAVFYSIRAAARHMRPRKSGSIIVTTSVSALRPAVTLGAAYAAAKAGAAQLVRATALELAGDGVRVNAIAPGPFETDIGGGFMHQDEIRAKMAAGVPMGRVADVEEIKPLALYLASRASGFVTGQQFVIDGGLSLSAARA